MKFMEMTGWSISIGGSGLGFSGDVYHLPESINTPIRISMKGGGDFDILVTENVNVKCESKPERSLKINVR